MTIIADRSKLARFKEQFFCFKKISSSERFTPQCKHRIIKEEYRQANTIYYHIQNSPILFRCDLVDQCGNISNPFLPPGGSARPIFFNLYAININTSNNKLATIKARGGNNIDSLRSLEFQKTYARLVKCNTIKIDCKNLCTNISQKLNYLVGEISPPLIFNFPFKNLTRLHSLQTRSTIAKLKFSFLSSSISVELLKTTRQYSGTRSCPISRQNFVLRQKLCESK